MLSKKIVMLLMISLILSTISFASADIRVIQGPPKPAPVLSKVVTVHRLDLTNQYVQITNRKPDAIDLYGWRITEKTYSHHYKFPHFILKSGATMTLFTGQGPKTKQFLHGGPVWDTTHDTAYLYAPSGRLYSKLGL